MSKTELELVPMDDLMEEVERRCPSFIAAFVTVEPEEKGIDWFYYGKGLRSKAIQLAAELQNEVINNWNGELRTLQRINSDE